MDEHFGNRRDRDMILTSILCLLAAAFGWIVATRVRPVRRPLIFLLAAALLLLVSFGVRAFQGFEGLPLSESLLLFEGSWVAYFGFNLQVAYRAFALPLLVLSFATLVLVAKPDGDDA